MIYEIKLPRKHAEDWWQRLGDDWGSEMLGWTPRTITLRLTAAGLNDLIADCRFYIECMGPDDTGSPDEDYRPAARRCLRALERQQLVAS